MRRVIGMAMLAAAAVFIFVCFVMVTDWWFALGIIGIGVVGIGWIGAAQWLVESGGDS